MRYKEEKLKSLLDLLHALAQHRRGNEPVWFRGQARASWTLRPSLARKPKRLNREQSLAKRFKQDAFLLLSERPQSEWEWLFIMQHHGVPTRLLDWTESPLVGIYFAVNEVPRSAGALWVLLPVELNQSANVPTTSPADLPAFEEDIFLTNYLPSSMTKEGQSRLKPVAFLAPRNTTRSQAQLAVFTITHPDLTPIERIGDGRHVWRYIIPPSAKGRIRKELEDLYITPLTLFPELGNVGTKAKEILK